MAELRSYVYDEKKRCYVRPDGPLQAATPQKDSKPSKLKRWALVASAAIVLMSATIYVLHLFTGISFKGTPAHVQDLNIRR
jgi:hypothetical protein